MGFWVFMVCSNFMIPLFMIGFGYFFKKFGAGELSMMCLDTEQVCPRKINRRGILQICILHVFG